jgi:dipeptidyl-peptidase 4
MSSLRIFLLTVLLAILCVPASSQVPDSLTVEWLYSSEASRLTATPAFQWLDDSRLVLLERGTPDTEGTLSVQTLPTGRRSSLVDLKAARTSLRALLGETTPAVLPFPDVLDGQGRWSVYLFDGDIFLLDHAAAAFSRVTTTAIAEKCVSLSPDGRTIAFVRENDLFAWDIASRQEHRLTSDGSQTILNGTLSWVYWEEIFGRHDTGYWWSPDSRSIAYFQTDESGVSVQQYADVTPWIPRIIRQPYPKVGGKNPSVRVGVVSLNDPVTTWIDLSHHEHEYVVRVGWLPGGKRLSVQTLNRLQTQRDLFLADPVSGRTEHLLTESDSAWVEIFDGLTFLRDGSGFLWPSERDGYQHLYLHDMHGTLVRKVTRGPWTLREAGGVAWVRGGVVFVDEDQKIVYFTALEKSPLERHLYCVGLDGKGFTRLSTTEGSHSITFSPNGRYYLDRSSSVSITPSLSIHESNGALLRVIRGGVQVTTLSAKLSAPEFFSIPARDGFSLPAQVLKPRMMATDKRFPVILYVYGGPSAPTVVNGWQRDLFWENLLVQNGFIVMHCDNRSATGISKTLEQLVLHRMVGSVELNDLVDAVRWIKRLPYVDSSRIGIWGWSGGGSNTLLGMTRSAEFKAGIAVAGVTDFRFYDTRLAEQYMRTERENLAGYEENSLLRYAKELHGRLLLVHGTYDDNVHIQNTFAFMNELIKANKQFDLMVYPMRMHGITDRPARIHLYTTMLEFWKRWL